MPHNAVDDNDITLHSSMQIIVRLLSCLQIIGTYLNRIRSCGDVACEVIMTSLFSICIKFLLVT